MALRIGFIALLAGLYGLGQWLAAAHAQPWIIASLMGLIFIGLVAAMYLCVLPALLALPILAVALACVAGMQWKDLLTNVVQGGATKLGPAMLAVILGAILAKMIEMTGIAQTAIKKAAELGGDRPIILAVILTAVMSVLFVALTGLGGVIMVATITIPILLSLGLRPLFAGSLVLMSLSLGGIFNLANWEIYKTVLGLSQSDIFRFALPFAVVMTIATAAFITIESKRMGKARFKAMVMQQEETQTFVPWYALLTPLIPLIPVVAFNLFNMFSYKAPVVTFSPTAIIPPTAVMQIAAMDGANSLLRDPALPLIELQPGDTIALPKTNTVYEVVLVSPPAIPRVLRGPAGLTLEGYEPAPPNAQSIFPTTLRTQIAKPDSWTSTKLDVVFDGKSGQPTLVAGDAESTKFEFPVIAAMLLGILYCAVTTWRRGVSTVQMLTKASFDGVAAVGPALVIMIGIGMVFMVTYAGPVSDLIQPLIARIAPNAAWPIGMQMLYYVVLFTILAPLALYRGPLNLWGMGAGLVAALNGPIPAGALMGALMSVGMIQGVSDPTNTHNVWVANYTNTDVQDILKRTLPYTWAVAVLGLIVAALFYYGGLAKLMGG